MCVCYASGGCFIGVKHNSISFENIFKKIGRKNIYMYVCVCMKMYAEYKGKYIYKYQIFLLFCTIIDEYDDT